MISFRAAACVVGGALIPVCVRNVVVLLLKPTSFPAIHSISGELTLLIVHAIPFAVAVHLLSPEGDGHGRRDFETYRAGRTAGVTGIVVAVVTILAIHISVWVPVYGPGRSSSTAPIALILAPLFGLAFGCAGYGVGRAIAWAVFRITETPYPPLCEKCGHSLRGLNGPRCPECGATLDPNQLTPARDADNP